MSNPPGSPIWYELMTHDPGGSKRFYDAVVGWTVEAEPSGDMDYRMITAPCGLAAGVLRITPQMEAGGARPAWLMYVRVQDVDATAEKVRSLGGYVIVPPTGIPGIGRFSLLADPQGAPFYIMRANSPDTPSVFAPGEPGRCGWNDLLTNDLDGALAFYGTLFGWENRESLETDGAGTHHFLDLGKIRLGAATHARGRRAHWNMFFTVPDIHVAIAHVQCGGGTVIAGPTIGATGACILLGTDPQGARFALIEQPAV